jgi:hypothetical protein
MGWLRGAVGRERERVVRVASRVLLGRVLEVVWCVCVTVAATSSRTQPSALTAHVTAAASERQNGLTHTQAWHAPHVQSNLDIPVQQQQQHSKYTAAAHTHSRCARIDSAGCSDSSCSPPPRPCRVSRSSTHTMSRAVKQPVGALRAAHAPPPPHQRHRDGRCRCHCEPAARPNSPLLTCAAALPAPATPQQTHQARSG